MEGVLETWLLVYEIVDDARFEPISPLISKHKASTQRESLVPCQVLDRSLFGG
jgi:hypothetical protein